MNLVDNFNNLFYQKFYHFTFFSFSINIETVIKKTSYITSLTCLYGIINNKNRCLRFKRQSKVFPTVHLSPSKTLI